MPSQTRNAAPWRAATWVMICLISMGLVFSVIAGA